MELKGTMPEEEVGLALGSRKDRERSRAVIRHTLPRFRVTSARVRHPDDINAWRLVRTGWRWRRRAPCHSPLPPLSSPPVFAGVCSCPIFSAPAASGTRLYCKQSYPVALLTLERRAMDEPERSVAAEPEWELSKENFQPLRAGRKPAGLRDTGTDTKKQSVDEQRQCVTRLAPPVCNCSNSCQLTTPARAAPVQVFC
jgi:hypothetical protein